jgi:hypothetical protein
MSDDLATISSRISSLEAGHRVSLPTPGEEVSDLISMAPGSQEATFLSEDEHEEGESSNSMGNSGQGWYTHPWS